MLAQHRGDLLPTIDPAQPHLPARHEADTALLDSGAALSSGWSAPRIRRVLPPAKYVATTASFTSRIRRWYRGRIVDVHSFAPAAPNRVARGSVSATGPLGPVSVRSLVPLR